MPAPPQDYIWRALAGSEALCLHLPRMDIALTQANDVFSMAPCLYFVNPAAFAEEKGQALPVTCRLLAEGRPLWREGLWLG